MRELAATCVLCLVGFPAIDDAAAQAPIPKLMRIIVPFSAGASNDAIARAIAVPLAKRPGTSVVIDNRPGAAGVIGSDAVAKSPPDASAPAAFAARVKELGDWKRIAAERKIVAEQRYRAAR